MWLIRWIDMIVLKGDQMLMLHYVWCMSRKLGLIEFVRVESPSRLLNRIYESENSDLKPEDDSRRTCREQGCQVCESYRCVQDIAKKRHREVRYSNL